MHYSPTIRKWQRLPGNAGRSLGSVHVVLDTESGAAREHAIGQTLAHRLKVGVARSWRMEGGRPTRSDELVFRSPDELWSWLSRLCSARRSVRVWAHNCGFDATLCDVWSRIERKEYALDWCVLEDPPTILHGRFNSGKLIWLDSLNWWRCPLAELARTFGLVKGELPPADASEGEWIDYCRNDVAILETAVQQLIAAVGELDLGNLAYTAPGQALRHFRHRGWGKELVLHGHLHALTLEREAYYGGQFECFYRGEVQPFGLRDARDRQRQYAYGHLPDVGPISVFDRSSAYPATMLNEKYPAALGDYVETMSIDGLTTALRSAFCIASVQLQTDQVTFPKRRPKDVIYPIGKYWTVLSHPELEYALSLDLVKAVGRVAFYYAKPLLAKYADFWIKQRELWAGERGPAWGELAKLFGNALHGKLGQRAYQWIELPGEDPPYPWGYYWTTDTDDGRLVKRRAVAGFPQEEQVYQTPLPEEVAGKDETAEEVRKRIGEGKHSAPAVAGAVTAYNRQWMREARDQAGKRCVYHQAGDALIVNEDGAERLRLAGLVRESQVGFFKAKGQAESATFWGLNDYELDGKATIAGLPPSADWIERGLWSVRKFDRIDSLIVNGHVNGNGGPNGTVLTHDVEVRKARPVDTVRRVGDGWIKPLEVDES